MKLRFLLSILLRQRGSEIEGNVAGKQPWKIEFYFRFDYPVY